MAEYIEKNHFDERIKIAVGMAEGDFTEDFKNGVLFVLELLKTEDSADVIERENVKNLIENAIEDNWELDYLLERLKEI